MTVFRRSLRLALGALVLGWFVALEARSAAAASGGERWAFYVPADPASRASLLAHLAEVDVVVPAYFGVQTSGRLAGAPDPFVDRAVVEAGKRLLPLVQSQRSNGDPSPDLDDPARRVALVAALSSLTDAGPYAGLTLDLEGVRPGDRAGLTSLVRELATALHARGRALAVAVPANDGSGDSSWSAAYDDAAIGAVADRVILMAYAYRTEATASPGPISPLPWVRAVSGYAAARIPPACLLLGVGVWGYDWNVSRPGRATTLRYADTLDLIGRTVGHLRSDSVDAAVEYAYQAAGDQHEVWFEDAATLKPKLALVTTRGLAGVAIWRLGQEPPGLWDELGEQPDFAIPGGWFFGETSGATGLGYRVVDDEVRFWSEFRRLGGVTTLGYPISRRYVGKDGFTYQAFQRGVLQWRPERGVAELANTFEQLTAAGQDPSLLAAGIPLPVIDDGSGGDWNRARQIRLGWLTDPSIAAAFVANPNPAAIATWSVDRSIELYGLPASRPVRSGPFVVQRFQRISLQLWVDDVPGMPRPGSVVGILGGDLLKRAGLLPAEATAPEESF